MSAASEVSADAHAEALRSLHAWVAPSPRLAELRELFTGYLDEHPDALDRSCSPGHLTAGALVLSADLDGVLLNLHAKAQRWFHFGGHWEPGDDSLLATASREAAEESGVLGLRVHPEPVHLDVHRVEFCRGHVRADHLDVRYAAVAPPGAEAHPSEESLALRWWPVDALPDLPAEMRDLIALARERLQRADAPSASRRAPAE